MEQLTTMKRYNTNNEPKTISSREVAEMMEVKEHAKMLRKIDDISKILNEAKIGLVDYWNENRYKAGNGEMKREYQVTKKGCELIAHKTTGEKGVVFTVKYMERFEAMEKALKDSYMIDDPIERAKRWIEEQEERKALELQTKVQQQVIGELKPKADYTDYILKSESLVNITQIAKDYDMTGQAMNKLLNDLGVQYKQSGQWLLYSKYHGKSYTMSVTEPYFDRNGTAQAKLRTKWTQKGRLFLYDLLKENGTLPTMER